MRRSRALDLALSAALAAGCANLTGLTAGATDAGADAATDGAKSDGTSTDAAQTDAAQADAPPSCNAYAQAVMLDQPVAYFRLFDSNGPACANAVTGSTYTCIFSPSGLTYRAPGRNGCASAVHLDGQSGSVTLADAAGALDFPGNVAFTLEAWVEVDVADAGADGVPLAAALLRASTGSPGNGYVLTMTNGDMGGAPGPRDEVWIDDLLGLYAQSHSNPPASVPFHLVLLHNTADGLDHLYVNGVDAIDEGKSTAMMMANPERPATGLPLVWSRFAGSLGDVAIYDRALTNGQIIAHYLAGAS